jgi:hypothetical protein
MLVKNTDAKGKAELVVEIFEIPEYNCLEELVSQNILVSMHEAIPGLFGDKIAKPKREGTKFMREKLKTVPFQEIYLHNLEMAVSKNFETVFEEFLFETCKQESGLSADDKRMKDFKPIYKIDTRRLYVSVSNGWKGVLGKEVEIRVSAPNQDFICKSDQPFYKLDHFIPNELCALVFRIQYDA